MHIHNPRITYTPKFYSKKISILNFRAPESYYITYYGNSLWRK